MLLVLLLHLHMDLKHSRYGQESATKIVEDQKENNAIKEGSALFH